MSPDAPTSPPGSASGLNFFSLPAFRATRLSAFVREGTEAARGHLPIKGREDLKMKKLFAILALSATLLTAAACNTVRGAGRDAQSAANAVDNEM
jgi:predicted small secreted protein